MEFGLEGQYIFGTFTPDYGGGYVPTPATEATAQEKNVPVGSLGFPNRNGYGWNSLENRFFSQTRLKAFMKAQF